jgi:hypothetical protein
MAQRISRRLQLVELMVIVAASAGATAWTHLYATQYATVVLGFPKNLMAE